MFFVNQICSNTCSSVDCTEIAVAIPFVETGSKHCQMMQATNTEGKDWEAIV